MAGLITVQENHGIKCSSCERILMPGEGVIQSADKVRVFHYPVCPPKFNPTQYELRNTNQYNVDENWE